MIGLDLMRCIALLYMNRWLAKFRLRLKTLEQQDLTMVNDIADQTAELAIEEILTKAWTTIKTKEEATTNPICQIPTTKNTQNDKRAKGPIGKARQQKIDKYLKHNNIGTDTRKTQRNKIKDPKLTKLQKLKSRETKIAQAKKYGQKRLTPTETDRLNKLNITKEIMQKQNLPAIGIKLTPAILSLYVDDQFSYGEATMRGLRYNKAKGALELSSDQEAKDDLVKADERSIRLLAEIGNSIDKDIQLTYDAPSMNKGGKMPLLDTEVWLETNDPQYKKGKIMFSHYRKPMASNLTIQEKSALPHKQKITIMTQEILRIKRNTHPDVPEQVWKQHCTNYMQRMKNSGWHAGYRKRVLKAGLTGWYKIVEKELNEKIPRYRHHDYKKDERAKAKEAKKRTWFKPRNKNKNKHETEMITATEEDLQGVLIIDATPDEEIKTMMEAAIADSILDIRVVERPGPKHQDAMIATNNNPKTKCEQVETCLICQTEKGGDCRKKEIVYELLCAECKPNAPVGYDGQSARNGFSRGLEHLKKPNSTKPEELEKSVIWRHQQDKHDGQEVQWEMKIHKAFQKQPLDRMICEARRINARPKEHSLNSKHEHAKSGMVKLKFTSDIKEAKEIRELAKTKIEEDRAKWKKTKIQQQNTNTEQPNIQKHPTIKQLTPDPPKNNIATTPDSSVQPNSPKNNPDGPKPQPMLKPIPEPNQNTQNSQWDIFLQKNQQPMEPKNTKKPPKTKKSKPKTKSNQNKPKTKPPKPNETITQFYKPTSTPNQKEGID